jgi:hypothetical protein
MIASLAVIWFAPNSNEITAAVEDRLNKKWFAPAAGAFAGALLAMGLMVMNSGRVSPFLYFQF